MTTTISPLTVRAESPSRERTDSVLASLAEHWAKARIDSPFQLINRLDDAAKLIIMIAGILQGVLTAVIKLDDERLGLVLANIAVLASAALLASIGFAAWAIVTSLQPGSLNSSMVFELLRKTEADDPHWTDLNCEIKRWCGEIAAVAVAKRRRLTLAMCMLGFSMLMSVLCVAIMTGLLRMP